MLTLKTPYVWITILNILMIFLTLLKAMFIWGISLIGLVIILFFILILLGISWHFYFTGIHINEGETTYKLRRLQITTGDKAFLEIMSKPIAYILAILNLVFLVNIVFFKA